MARKTAQRAAEIEMSFTCNGPDDMEEHEFAYTLAVGVVNLMFKAAAERGLKVSFAVNTLMMATAAAHHGPFDLEDQYGDVMANLAEGIAKVIEHERSADELRSLCEQALHGVRAQRRSH